MSCGDPESFVRWGPIYSDVFAGFFSLFFQLMRGERIQIQIKLGFHRLVSEMPFQWCFASGLMLAQH